MILVLAVAKSSSLPQWWVLALAVLGALAGPLAVVGGWWLRAKTADLRQAVALLEPTVALVPALRDRMLSVEAGITGVVRADGCIRHRSELLQSLQTAMEPVIAVQASIKALHHRLDDIDAARRERDKAQERATRDLSKEVHDLRDSVMRHLGERHEEA